MFTGSIFRTDFGSISRPDNPEILFHELQGRDQGIKHLWAHQADILRAYHQQHHTAQDVAVELPTGMGKTLIGLLIAEFQRLSADRRVAYLCPTRQLARQVGTQARNNGIQAHVLVGKQSNYPVSDFSEYQSGQAIAITTYSAIFNSGPRFGDAQVLILDDAHAGENYIASMWSVEILKAQHPDVFLGLVELLKNELESGLYDEASNRSSREQTKPNPVDLVPRALVCSSGDAIRTLLDQKLSEHTPPWFAWRTVRDHLAACNLFVAGDSILIRPFIPPTQTHHPFSGAKHRVYMSATLGEGGELERITGVKMIQRLVLSADRETPHSGRRLFLVPEIGMSQQGMLTVAMDAIEEVDRSLVLTPSRSNSVGKALVKEITDKGIDIIEASDIEEGLGSFVSKEKAVLLLSRYDGLDLPDEDCRLLIFGGLPSGMNLQERFLWSRLSASSILGSRVMTRFAQGVGRCTRSGNDYALVLVIGQDMVDFLLKRESQEFLGSELQAELKFGIENSVDASREHFRAIQRAFFSQNDEWLHAENAIKGLIKDLQDTHSNEDVFVQKLRSVVSDELDYLYSMWTGDFETALVHARNVADGLGGDETKAYRGWWYFLSAETANLLHSDLGEEAWRDVSRDMLLRASKCCIGISWLTRLGRTLDPAGKIQEIDETTARAAENIKSILTGWGVMGPCFEQKLQQIAAGLRSTKHSAFHSGLLGLGKILGFSSEVPPGNGAPDCVWSIGNSVHVLHEAKSEHTPADSIGINDIRQANGHADWARENLDRNDKTEFLCLIESPRTKIVRGARTHAKELCHVSPETLNEIFNRISDVLSRVRSKTTDLSDEGVLEEIAQKLKSNNLAPVKILDELSKNRVKEMKQSG